MAGPATRFGTYKVTEWREGVQPQKTWIQKRIWKPRSSRFSGGKGCSRRKHGYRKESGSRALLAFLALPLAGSRALLVLNGGKGCSRRKHGYRKESGSRALLAFLAGRGAAAENMDTEKNLEAALFSLFSPTSKSMPGSCPNRRLALQGVPAENMYRKESGAALFSLFWREGVQPQQIGVQPQKTLEISSLKMFRLQCGLFLTQDVSPAVWRWRLLNARCFACSFWMAPSCLPFEHCNINFSCHSNIALWSAIL